MSTHKTPDPWGKNLHAPRSLREAYGDEPKFLKPMPSERFTLGEHTVCIVCAIGLAILLWVTR